jgi:hypothetical protein
MKERIVEKLSKYIEDTKVEKSNTAKLKDSIAKNKRVSVIDFEEAMNEIEDESLNAELFILKEDIIRSIRLDADWGDEFKNKSLRIRLDDDWKSKL